VKGNFFDRLTARALGAAPVSQPVLPSLFSPVAQVGAMESAAAPASEGGETPAWAPLSEDVRETAPSRTVPRRENSHEASREPDAVRRELMTRDLTLPEIGESLPRETTIVPPQVETRVPPRADFDLTPRGVLVASRATNVSPTPPERTSHAQLGVKPVITRGAVRSATDSSPRDSVDAGVAEGTGKNGSQSVAEPAAPVVRVTIGRVEVRAQFPAAPSAPAPRRSRALTLSLEDYLKQRSGGRR
jgi:hypothetical protein